MSYASKKAARARSKTMLGSALYGPWKAPFHYDEAGCLIYDASGHRVLDLRGWGYLTGQGCGALGMSQDAAVAIQDRVGKRVVELLNADAEDALTGQLRPEFLDRMAVELTANAHKGNWAAWKPSEEHITSEIRHHFHKLEIALLERDPAKVSEYAADVANLVMKADEVHGEQRTSNPLQNNQLQPPKVGC